MPRMRINFQDALTEIRPNLHRALCHLRYPDKDRTIWANALSINHYDISKRNDQVKLLREINSKAHETVLWLGEETPIYETHSILLKIPRMLEAIVA